MRNPHSGISDFISEMKNSYFKLLSILIISAVTVQAGETEDGWQKLAENNDKGAMSYFTTALEANPKDVRASLGMTFTYLLRQNNRRAWESYNSAIQNASEPQALLYAGIGMDFYSYTLSERTSGIEQRFAEVIEKPDALGIARTMAYEYMGIISTMRGDVEKAHSWYAKMGAITKWRMIGPFHNVSASGHDKVFPPEKVDEPGASYEGASGCKVNWFVPTATRIDHWIDGEQYFPWVDGVYYYVTYVKSPSKQRVHFRLGTSGAYKLFLNDAQVSENFEEFNNDLDTYNSEVTMSEGWNKVLVKIDNSELTRCNFLFRITNATGEPLSGLEFSLDPKQYTKSDPGAVAIPNPFTTYFQKQIDAHPDHLENYLLLAICYLRNDNVTDAESVLRKLTAKHPDFISALNYYLDMYTRGRRRDDWITTVERIKVLRPDLPLSIMYAFRQDFEAERYDEAEKSIELIQKSMPGSSYYYDAAIEIAAKKNRLDQLNDLLENAFAAHPDNLGYTSANILLALNREGRHNAAHAMIDKHLKEMVSSTGYMIKANIYLNEGDVEEFEKWYNKALELEPVATDKLATMAEVYTNRKDFAKALDIMKRALSISPTNSMFWYRVGTLERSMGNNTAAMEAYQKSIEYGPSNFDAREAVRDLKGLPDPFSKFSSYNIDSLIANAPDASKFPEDDAIYLVDDQKRVVLDGSRAEAQYEMLIRVFNKEGIDRFKEMSLPGGYSLTVEKAIVRKPNGREIPADVSGDEAVFKTLEEGDFIYIKTRDKEYRNGSLSKYFSAKFYFNSYMPVANTRFILSVPNGTDFQFNMANSEAEPKITTDDANQVYTWEMHDLPAIESEESMPDLDDIGIILQVTSVKDWEAITGWYYDIARTKSRTSREVKELVDSLFPPTQKFTKQQLVEGVYKYITTNIRYSNVPFRQSGIVPQKARDVLLTRIGDCKDMATLCISMLAERDVVAYHVLVQTYTSALAKNSLPSDDFDHDIVFVDMGEKGMFIDLTADDVPVGSLPSADLDAFCLVVKQGWRTPQRLVRNQFTPSNLSLKTNITLQSDFSASITQVYTHTGSRTQWYRSSWKTATKKEIEKQLKEWLAEDFADAKLESYEIKGIDDLESTVSYSLTFTVPNFALEAGDMATVKVPWYNPFTPTAALSYEKRTYPYEYWNGIDTLSEHVSITIPDGFQSIGSNAGNTFSHTVAEYALNSSTQKNKIELNRKLITKRRIVMPNEYADYKTFFNKIVRADRQSVLLGPQKGKKK